MHDDRQATAERRLPRVLLLDDDETTLQLLAAMLRGCGVQHLAAAQDGEGGLAHLDGSPDQPDLLICDLRMPGMDGIEFLRHAAERGYDGDVVLLSGVSPGVLKAAERLAQAHGLGLLGVLEKPVTREALAATLERCGMRPSGTKRAGPVEALTPQAVRAGLAAGCIELLFQPKVATTGRRFLGVECLARWRDAERGLLPPGAFIPVVEQHGMIDDFTLAVFRAAVARQQAWQAAGRTVPISVNVSMDNLLRIDLPEILGEIVRQAGVKPRNIVLEVTESRLMQDLRLSLDILIRLRLMGFGLSIDDFGTGYSTLETLRQLPFSELKVDRAFVSGAAEDGAARAILESSVHLGRTFGLNVVAEGVETRRDWDAVQAAGCNEVQGYFVARPMPAQDLFGWIDTWEQSEIPACADGERPLVVVVEDDEAMREVIAAALERSFRIVALASGEQALNSVAGTPPDAILLDVQLHSGIDGYETCRRLRLLDATADTPVIFLSGRDGIEDRLKGYEAGGDDYVVKPFDRQEITAKLGKQIAASAARAELRRRAHEAGSTALTAMTSMSEMGALLETMKRFGACSGYQELADAVLGGLALYGLTATVQLRAPDEVLTRSAAGEASSLEVSVIGHMATMERIVQFRSRLSVTYQRVSLLVHDMPVDDADRCGRLRDHLAMLAEGADARAEAIAANIEASRRGVAIEAAVARISDALEVLDRTQRERQASARHAVDALTQRMETAYVSVALTTEQEEFMHAILTEGVERLLQTQAEVPDLQDRLSAIVRGLREITGAHPGK